jgi:hypothetical protein
MNEFTASQAFGTLFPSVEEQQVSALLQRLLGFIMFAIHRFVIFYRGLFKKLQRCPSVSLL